MRALGRPAMKGLAAALDAGSGAPPFHRSQLLRQIPEELVQGGSRRAPGAVFGWDGARAHRLHGAAA